MNWAINYWAVLVASLVAMCFGALWYSKLLFVKTWMKLARVKPNGRSPPLMMLFGFLGTLVTTFTLAVIMKTAGIVGAVNGLLFGLFIGVGILAMGSLGIMLWQGKPAKLYFIVAIHEVIAFALLGVILGAW